MVLNRNPLNYFAEVEQLAFSSAHLVPGIEPSPDKMLQGRLFSYSDTHRHRLGVNYQSIPVNCPFATQHSCMRGSYQRDGNMVVDGNKGNAPNYFPNSFGGPVPDVSGAATWNPEKSSGDVMRVETGGEDNFTQCGLLFRNVLCPGARERLTDNIANNLVNAQDFIQQRAIANFAAADANYGRMIREKIAKIQATRREEEKEKTSASSSFSSSSSTGFNVNVTKGLSPARVVPGKLSNL